MQAYLLSIVVFLPLLASLGVLLIPSAHKKMFKTITLVVTFIQLVLAGIIYVFFQKGELWGGVHRENSFQFVEKWEWIRLKLGSMGSLSIDYFVGVDGLSITLVLLTGIVMCIGAISSWTIQKYNKGYFALYLLLSGTVMGCFVALDFFLFYLFFEFMLLPMYFLIGIWGGVRREYASIKFFIYTLVGSLFILVVMIGLYTSVIDPAKTAVEAGLVTNIESVTEDVIKQVQLELANEKIASEDRVHTFSLLAMMDGKNYLPDSFFHANSLGKLWGTSFRNLAFIALLIGFAIKLPVVPVHTWLPDAHVEAPTPVSVVLAGILLKIGGYGFLRIAYSIFPEGAQEYAWWIAFFGVLSIIYGGINALAMTDLKKMIAYSSVSHMGFVLLGIASLTPEGISGAVFQMFSHGILSAFLFLIVGVLYDRTQNRTIASYRGLLTRMPYYTSMVMIAFFASLGLPGFSGFIGELFTLLGGFSSELLAGWMVAIATLGIALGAAYFLWTLQRMFLGSFWIQASLDATKLDDLDRREWLMLGSLALLTFALGIFPHFIFDWCNDSAITFVNFIWNN